MKRDTRLMWVVVGLVIAGMLTGIVYGGHILGVWDWLWERSGLWRYFATEPTPTAFVAPAFVIPKNVSTATISASDMEIVGALINPDFEGLFVPQDGQGPLQLAKGWKAKWVEGMMGKPGIGIYGGGADNYPFRCPEWKRATLEFPYRVRSGESAQQWFSFSGIHYAGIEQNAVVTAGDMVAFTVYGQGWAGSSGNPLTNGDIYVSLGVDPECREDLESRSIVWTDWYWIPNAKSLSADLNNWTLFRSQPVFAKKNCMTVWVVTTAKWPFPHNDVYFDDAKMWKVSQGTEPCPTPTPVPTPVVTPQPGNCPNLEDIRGVIQQELIDRPPVIWPR